LYAIDGDVKSSTDWVDGTSLVEILCVEARPSLQKNSSIKKPQDCVWDSDFSVLHLENSSQA